MADIKLKLTVEGAADAKKAIDDVNQATETAAKTAEKEAKAAEESKRRVQEAVEARRAAIKAHADAQEALRAEAAEARVLAASTEKSSAATAQEVEGMSQLEKQAKRAADAVERLALAKGKSAAEANALADSTFDSVSTGAVSPGAAVWNVRAGFASEARDAKEAMASLNREARQAEGAWAAAGRGAAGAKASYAEFGRTARGIAEALLPNILVSRSIAAAGALKAVLVGLGAAGSVALAGIGAAAVSAWAVWRHYSEKIAESNRRLSESFGRLDDELKEAEREQRSFNRAGVELGAAEKAWKGVAAAAEESARSITAANAGTREAIADAEKYLGIKMQLAEVEIEHAAENKLASASTPEARENILRDRDRRLSRVRASGAVERARLELGALDLEESRIRENRERAAGSTTAAETKSRLISEDVRRRESYVGIKIDSRLGKPGHGIDDLISAQEASLADATKRKHSEESSFNDERAAEVAEEIHDINARLRQLRELKTAYANQKSAEAEVRSALEIRDRNDRAAEDRLAQIAKERTLAGASVALAERQAKLNEARQANSDAELNRKQQERADKVAARADKAAAKGERQSEAEVLGDRAVRGVSSVNAREASNSDRGRREIAATAERVRAAGAALHDADGATAKDLIELSAALRDFGKLLERGPKAGLNAGIAELRREIDQLKSQLRETRN